MANPMSHVLAKNPRVGKGTVHLLKSFRNKNSIPTDGASGGINFFKEFPYI
jgi:hypothetical protein